MSLSARPRRRRGFTLVEMLVVIMIIAMLMAITTFAIWRVIIQARVAKIFVELDQLSQAMNGYKQTRMQYPPCMGTQIVDNRKKEFLRHISQAFTNANYGSSVTDFNNLTTTVNTNYGVSLNNLDQAEALVFWLGGFPTPNGSSGPVANRKLFGFHRDEDDPFKRSIQFEQPTPLQYRTDPLFGFEEARLSDVDGDGWLEYSPLTLRASEPTPPYVYFDSFTYGGSTNTTSSNGIKHYCYPRPDGGPSGAVEQMCNVFGLAGPLATMIDPSKTQTTRWANSPGIQIICAGLDGRYSEGIPYGSDYKKVQRAITYPKGQVFSSNDQYGSFFGLSREEFDNQTNLSNLTLDGAQRESGQ